MRLALRSTTRLGDRSAVMMGTSEIRRKVFLQVICEELGPEKSGALIIWHALTGCDTTGHIHGKGNKGCLANFHEGKPHHPDSTSWSWPRK